MLTKDEARRIAANTKSKHHKPKVFARQRDNYGYWNARGYAQRDFFFR